MFIFQITCLSVFGMIEKNERLCKNCCIDLAVDAEYINKFNEGGEIV